MAAMTTPQLATAPAPVPLTVRDAVRVDARAVFGWLVGDEGSSRLSWHVKRAVDVVLAAIALALTAPLLLLAILAIRLESRGPAIFRQERAGWRGQPFRMLKLRTMVADASALEARLMRRDRTFFKLSNDPRVTRVGRLLRRTSIDELPQLINVLRGEMSLVGPRPLLLTDLRNFPDSAHRVRFAMLPGITGLWQVSGRSSTTDAERLRLDRDYVQNWSLWLDLRILLKTLPAVVSSRGAV